MNRAWERSQPVVVWCAACIVLPRIESETTVNEAELLCLCMHIMVYSKRFKAGGMAGAVLVVVYSL